VLWSRAVSGENSRVRKRAALVLSGGGSRGAYEAGFLSYLFEEIYPELGEGFEFDIVSGSSVGAIHAAYVACSSGMKPAERARLLVETWHSMHFDTVLRVSWTDFVGIPLRSIGLLRAREDGSDGAPEVKGGLVDVGPLEELVRTRIPWHRLRMNLSAGKPGVLCTTVTDVNNGVVRIFLDGPAADTTPWLYDPHVDAVVTGITDLHVRASAAIPFLFPAVRIGEHFYVDGGLRLNTPLSPVVRLAAQKILVVGVGKRLDKKQKIEQTSAEALSHPAFLFGKVLDVILLDPIEHELRQLKIINGMLSGGAEIFGDDFTERLAPALRAVRGAEYRHIDYFMQTPSADVGRIAAECYHSPEGSLASPSLIAELIKRSATMGVPEDDADFLSYIYFDRVFTDRLVELGREDAKASRDRILELLLTDGGGDGET
jgi:NTE family protein